MSNLSKVLSGVILLHDHFGTHLDNSNDTVDEELELKNFEHAGEILAKLWSKLVINDQPVVAKLFGKSHRALLSQSRKNKKPIMSVSCGTFYKLSNALTQLVALHSKKRNK